MIIVKKNNESVEVSLQGSAGNLMFEAASVLNALKDQLEKKIGVDVPEELFIELIKVEMAKMKQQAEASKIAKAALEAIERGADQRKTFEDCLKKLKKMEIDVPLGLTATVDENKVRKLFGMDEEQKGD